MRMSHKYLPWVAIPCAVVIATICWIPVSRSRARVDFSSIPKNMLPFYQEAPKCKLVSDTKVDLLKGHNMHMYRYACDTEFINHLPKEVQDQIYEDGEFPDGAEALIFIEQKWFSRKVLFATFTTGHFMEVMYTRVDDHPTVFTETESQGSAAYGGWSLVSVLPNGEIGAIEPLEHEFLQSALPHGKFAGGLEPLFENGAMFLSEKLYREGDVACCPTGEVLISRYTLTNGKLSIKYTKRTTEAGAQKLIDAAATEEPAPHSNNGTSDTQGNITSTEQHRPLKKEIVPESESGVIDTVKVRKDPKGGWFGPSLRDVYPKGEDKPVLFCDSGPSFPTGKLVTIFYREVESKPDSSACKAAVAVIEGEGVWKDGKAVTQAELAQMREQEVHFINEAFSPLESGRGELTAAWRKPKPIGDPCLDTSGVPEAVSLRYKGQNCSIVVLYPNIRFGYVLFVNWNIVGINDANGDAEFGLSPTPKEVIQTIGAEYGSKYIVSR